MWQNNEIAGNDGISYLFKKPILWINVARPQRIYCENKKAYLI